MDLLEVQLKQTIMLKMVFHLFELQMLQEEMVQFPQII